MSYILALRKYEGSEDGYVKKLNGSTRCVESFSFVIIEHSGRLIAETGDDEMYKAETQNNG